MKLTSKTNIEYKNGFDVLIMKIVELSNLAFNKIGIDDGWIAMDGDWYHFMAECRVLVSFHCQDTCFICHHQ